MNHFNRLIENRFGEDGSTADEVAENTFIQSVLTRRSVRRYQERMPSEGVIDVLTAAALSASSKSDNQQVSILRLADPRKRARLSEHFPQMPWIGLAPVFFVFLGDARRLQRIGALRGKPVDNTRLEGFFNASVDAALALQTMILAAEALGLGACPISVLRNKPEAVAEIMALPDLVFPVAGLCLGYPESEGHISLRLPRQLTVHLDTYDDKNLPVAIDDYDQRRHQRHPIASGQQRAVAAYGTAPFYGWSEDKALHVAEAEGSAFPIYLKSHGFNLL